MGFLSSLKTAYNLVSYLTPASNEDSHQKEFWDKQELDPHSVVYSICTGKFKGASKPEYWVDTHVVILQPIQAFEYRPCPSATINVQGPIRTYQNWNGQTVANRGLINRLYDVIHKALYWDKPHAKGNDIKNIYRICLKGLDSFIEPYKDDVMIINEIEKCKTLIQEGLEHEVEKPNYGPLAERVNALWTEQFRSVAHTMILSANELQGNVPATKDYKCSFQVNSLEQLLQERGLQFHEILNERKV